MKSRRYYWYIFGALIIIETILYLFLVDNSIWADEAYSMMMIRHSYSEIWKITAADVHPPLYYFILKTLTYPFGYSLIAAKAVSVCAYIFILVFGGIQLKKLFDEKTAILFIALFFAFPYTMEYVTEVRMYSISAAFVFANAVYAYRCFIESSKRNWVLFVFFGVAAAYTHYFALVSVGIIYGLLLIAIIIRKKKIWSWVIASTATIVLYLPWLKCFVEQLIYKVNNDYWISTITLRKFIGYGRIVFGVDGVSMAVKTMFSIISMSTYLITLIMIFRKKGKTDITICVCTLIIPIATVAVGVFVSALVRPVFVIRYILPSIPMVILFMAYALNRIGQRWALILVLIVSMAGGTIEYWGQYHDSKNISENYLDKEMEAEFSDADCYIEMTEQGAIWQLLAYYDSEKPIYRGDSIPKGIPYENRFSTNQFNAKEMNYVYMFLDEGESPTSKWTSIYECKYIRRVTDRKGNDAEVFLLTK